MITITYTGTLGAGETLCIDGMGYAAKLGAVNAMPDLSGGFPVIGSGNNEITYSDGEGSRDVRIAVIKRDRSV